MPYTSHVATRNLLLDCQLFCFLLVSDFRCFFHLAWVIASFADGRILTNVGIMSEAEKMQGFFVGSPQSAPVLIEAMTLSPFHVILSPFHVKRNWEIDGKLD